MAISNAEELQQAADQASALIQEIHDYCAATNRTIADVPEAKVRFPRGFIRTANYQRARFPFLDDHIVKSNIAYTLILSDTILWLSVRTDVGGTAQDMLYKLFVFLIGSVIESTTKVYLRGNCGRHFVGRLEFLVENEIIEESLKDELCWVWETRNRMHLFQLEDREYENEYDVDNHLRTIAAFRGLIGALEARGPYG